MIKADSTDRQKLLKGYLWFSGNNQYTIPAYSGFMPSPRLGRSLYGGLNDSVFAGDDLFGWYVSEVEEGHELQPGLSSLAHQIVDEMIKLGHGTPAHRIAGQEGRNLKDNIYWGFISCPDNWLKIDNRQLMSVASK